MLDTLKHRGPDGEGLFMERGLGMGMCRLAIQDVRHGHQPYISEDGQVVAIFNGEIYNYLELKEWLLRRGHQLRSRADGEVLTHLYEEYGQDLLSHIAGMFALAVWDKKKRQLLLARDRLGQKPLYLLHWAGTWAFASEIKAFMGLDGYYPVVDEEAISPYLAHRFVPAPHTLLQNITKLRPGEALKICRDGQWHRWLYWEPPLNDLNTGGSLSHWADQLDDVLRKTVAAHLAADVPIGLLLSGGLDSSLIGALATQSYPQELHAWTGEFSGRYPHCDELPWASRVAQYLGLPLHSAEVDIQVSPERLRQLAYILDEPMADPTVLPLDGLIQAASTRHKVVLSGEGADEIFGGYAGYGEVASLQWLSRIPPFLGDWWIRRGWKGSGALTRARIPISDRYRGVGFTFGREELFRLLSPDLRHSDRSPILTEYWRDAARVPALQAMQGFDARWFLGDDALLKTDRIGMHHQVEVRVPFCDHRVVQLALQTPLLWRRGAGHDKRVLRQVAQHYLPRSIVFRRKKGFPTPLTAWMAGTFYRAVWDTLTDSRFVSRRWFQPAQVQSLLMGLKSYNPRVARQVYALWMLELWMEELVEKPLNPRIKSPAWSNVPGWHPLR